MRGERLLSPFRIVEVFGPVSRRFASLPPPPIPSRGLSLPHPLSSQSDVCYTRCGVLDVYYSKLYVAVSLSPSFPIAFSFFLSLSSVSPPFRILSLRYSQPQGLLLFPCASFDFLTFISQRFIVHSVRRTVRACARKSRHSETPASQQCRSVTNTHATPNQSQPRA